MLSGETAAGAFPLESVTIMRKICEEAEQVLNYEKSFQHIREAVMHRHGKMSMVESVCSSAVETSLDCEAPLIIALTETGHTATLIAKYRPQCPILAITASETTCRQLLVARGVIPMLTASFVGTDSVIQKALAKAKDDGMVSAGQIVVAIHGQKEECAGASNLLKMVVVQ